MSKSTATQKKSPSVITTASGWQLCPKCNGAGYFSGLATTGAFDPCPVCKGKKIINIITGYPPK